VKTDLYPSPHPISLLLKVLGATKNNKHNVEGIKSTPNRVKGTQGIPERYPSEDTPPHFITITKH